MGCVSAGEACNAQQPLRGLGGCRTLRARNNLAGNGSNVDARNRLVVARQLVLQLVGAAAFVEEVDVIVAGHGECVAVGGEGVVGDGMVEQVVDVWASHSNRRLSTTAIEILGWRGGKREGADSDSDRTHAQDGLGGEVCTGVWRGWLASAENGAVVAQSSFLNTARHDPPAPARPCCHRRRLHDHELRPGPTTLDSHAARAPAHTLHPRPHRLPQRHWPRPLRPRHQDPLVGSTLHSDLTATEGARRRARSLPPLPAPLARKVP